MKRTVISIVALFACSARAQVSAGEAPNYWVPLLVVVALGIVCLVAVEWWRHRHQTAATTLAAGAQAAVPALKEGLVSAHGVIDRLSALVKPQATTAIDTSNFVTRAEMQAELAKLKAAPPQPAKLSFDIPTLVDPTKGAP